MLMINLRPRAATLLLPATYAHAMTMHHVRRVKLEFRNPSNALSGSLAIARLVFDTRVFLAVTDQMDF